MALSNELAQAGYTPNSVDATARVTFEVTDEEPAITGIQLQAKANIPNIDAATFQELAESAKKEYPVSKVLVGTEITLDTSRII